MTSLTDAGTVVCFNKLSLGGLIQLHIAMMPGPAALHMSIVTAEGGLQKPSADYVGGDGSDALA